MKSSISFTTSMIAALLSSILCSPALQAHDEGHGPKVTDVAKQGGVVAPVILAQDVAKGAKAALVHKAELVRTDEGIVRVYLYDSEMRPLDLAAFSKEAKGYLEYKKNKKWTKTPFALAQEEGAFVGKPPKAGVKPFNIDIHVDEGGKNLMAAFDHLD